MKRFMPQDTADDFIFSGINIEEDFPPSMPEQMRIERHSRKAIHGLRDLLTQRRLMLGAAISAGEKSVTGLVQ